jgi:2'-5' RNA ligase
VSDLAEPRAAATARVFFALWPDEPVRRQLIQHGEKMHRLLGGKLARAESVHMTLLFLGDVPVQQLEVLRALGGEAAFEPFTLRLDQTGCWKHNQVAWVAPAQIPPALARMVQTLEEGLESAGFRFDRRPLSPHITLLRKARCVPLLDRVPVIEWAVGEFVLVRSELHSEGSRYTVIGRWPTTPEAQP